MTIFKQLTRLGFLLCIGSLQLGHSQTIDDALRYSTIDITGTARGLGTGGALAAIGGDFASLAYNPAGIATYKFSELQVTPGFLFENAKSSLGNQSNRRQTSNFGFSIPSFGFVSSQSFEGRRTRHLWGIGINRTADFNREFEFSGDQTNSIAYSFIERSQGFHPDDLNSFYEGLAYESYLTIWDPNTNDYFSDIGQNEDVSKSQVVDQSGARGEISFVYGMDYDEKLHLGISLSLVNIRFDQLKRYSESKNDHPIFRQFDFEENLHVLGSGANLKIGAKYVLNRKLHLSAAFHSPTWMSITEEFDNEMRFDYIYDPEIFDREGPIEVQSPEGIFDYEIRTPWTAVGGIGLILGRGGFITAQAEFVDYTATHFTISQDPAYETFINDQIDDELRSVLSWRLGGEVRVRDARFRAGFSQTGQPYEESATASIHRIHAGVGYWFDQLFLDLGYRIQLEDQFYSPYSLNSGPQPIVATDFSRHQINLTLGVKF